MNKIKTYSVLLLSLCLISFLFFLYRQTGDGHEEHINHKTQTTSPKIEPQLRMDENRRCEGKIHTSPIPLNLKLRQYTRKKLVNDICITSNPLGMKRKWQTFDQIPQEELHNLLVDDRHGIIYCYVPKVACTAWKRVMIILSESLKVYGVPYRNPLDIPIENVHGSSLQHLNAYPKEVIKEKIETYKKFIFVRDPFVRLISAYKDKIQNTNQIYHETIGIEILQKFGNVSYPPESVEEARAKGIVPSFSNFIEYILSLRGQNDTEIDEHWRQAIHMCHPCQIDYDFIGKMETIEEDAEQLLRMLHVDNLVNFKWAISKTEPTEIKTWFANIPKEWRRKLYEVYEADFRLFGYEDHDNIDNI